jgi:uncharacterized membrane protein YjjP (DUF1212 family)
MKLKHLLIILLAGYSLSILGALFKTMHWAFAPELYIAGNILKVVFGVLLIIKLLGSNKLSDYLNW